MGDEGENIVFSDEEKQQDNPKKDKLNCIAVKQNLIKQKYIQH